MTLRTAPFLRAIARPNSCRPLVQAHPSLIRTLSLSTRLRIPILPHTPRTSPCITKARIQVPGRRGYANGKSSGRSESDLLVDELQELYEIATDEFEIATDSTNNATIYAASDRESARDALNQLSSVYKLYTADVTSAEFQDLQKQQGRQEQAQPEVEGESQVVATNFNPAEVSGEAREDVKKRVGQRVRELQNAVENLEEQAKAD